MSASAQITDLPKGAAVVANQSILRGRVLEVKRSESGTYTVITLPAPDQYSQPQNVEVRSKNMIGRPQEDVTVKVAIGGFRRGYKDKAGDQQYATNNTLVAIED